MLTAAAALTNGLSMAIEVLELLAATFVLEAFPSVVGSALRVFFGVSLLQYLLVGIQQRHRVVR